MLQKVDKKFNNRKKAVKTKVRMWSAKNNQYKVMILNY